MYKFIAERTHIFQIFCIWLLTPNEYSESNFSDLRPNKSFSEETFIAFFPSKDASPV